MTHSTNALDANERVRALLMAANDRRWGAQGLYQFASPGTAHVPQRVANAADETVIVLATASLAELVRRRARTP